MRCGAAQRCIRKYLLFFSTLISFLKPSSSQDTLYWKDPLHDILEAGNSCSILFSYLVTGKSQQPNPYDFWVACRYENASLWKQFEWFWLENAEQHLQQELVKVIDKKLATPSGNPRDYVSLSTYYWPDPTKPDGLPYIFRDGNINPEVQDGDLSRMAIMRRRIFDLGFAWNRTRDERFAERAAAQLRVWFLDPDSSMNPHLKYAQTVPGRHDGSPHGLIETLYLLELIDGADMLYGYGGWTTVDREGLKSWFREYLFWFLTSKQGKREAEPNNNHGSWYTAQAVKFALYVGRNDVALEVLEYARTTRFPEQFAEDCTQPHELARPDAFLYIQYNLNAWFHIAEVALETGIDFYSLSENGLSLKCALDWIVPFANGQREWKIPRLGSRGTKNLMPWLIRASQLWGGATYEETLRNLVVRNLQADVLHDPTIPSSLSGGIHP